MCVSHFTGARSGLLLSWAAAAVTTRCKNIRISVDILWRVFHISTQPVPVYRRNDEASPGPTFKIWRFEISVDVRVYFLQCMATTSPPSACFLTMDSPGVHCRRTSSQHVCLLVAPSLTTLHIYCTTWIWLQQRCARPCHGATDRQTSRCQLGRPSAHQRKVMWRPAFHRACPHFIWRPQFQRRSSYSLKLSPSSSPNRARQ